MDPIFICYLLFSYCYMAGVITNHLSFNDKFIDYLIDFICWIFSPITFPFHLGITEKE